MTREELDAFKRTIRRGLEPAVGKLFTPDIADERANALTVVLAALYEIKPFDLGDPTRGAS
jgi:hypothetical protein